MSTYIGAMKVALCVLLTLLLAGCLTAPVPVTMVTAPQAVNVADLTAKTVALLEVTEDGESDVFCSGVWVGARTIATAEHCVRGVKLGTQVSFATKADFYAPGSLHEILTFTPWASELVARDIDHDVALLKVVGNMPAHMVARIVTDYPLQGSQVHTLGAPLGVTWSYSKGDVAALRYLPGAAGSEILTVQVTAPISGGNSGGALFNDAGEVVGICRATYTRGQNMNLFTHISYVRSLLDQTVVGN